jgi:hypothetical protein
MTYKIYPHIKEVFANENKYYKKEISNLKKELTIKIKNINAMIKEIKKDKELSDKYLETLINLKNDLTF